MKLYFIQFTGTKSENSQEGIPHGIPHLDLDLTLITFDPEA